MQERPQLRDQLWDNAHRLYDGLKALGLQVSPQVSPVVAVTIKDRDQAIDWWNRAAATRRLRQPGDATGLTNRRQPAALQCQRRPQREQIDRIIEAFATLQASAAQQ